MPVKQSEPAVEALDPWADGSMDVIRAAEFTGLGRTRLLELANAGEVPSTKVGRRRLFARAGLVKLLRTSAEAVG
jgi:excisionase family DNA binding protein